MKRILLVANVDGFHNSFHLPYIERLKEQGFAVDLASRGAGQFANIRIKYDISFGRKPLDIRNISAFFQMRKVLATYYDLVYFSTPIPGMIGRLALLGRRHGKIIYCPHGYSFYSGNSRIRNWIFRSIERMLCHVTDCTIAINQEDFAAALRFRFLCKEIYKTNGVGIFTENFRRYVGEIRRRIREENGIEKEAFVLIYPAELSGRKNQMLLISIMEELRDRNILLLLPGAGEQEKACRERVQQLDLEGQIRFLGYRHDVNQLLGVSDLLVASSLHEGLPVNVMEAMAAGLPIVATNVRGHRDLVRNGVNGFLYKIHDPSAAAAAIRRLMDNPELYSFMSAASLQFSKEYDIQRVMPEYDEIWGI